MRHTSTKSVSADFATRRQPLQRIRRAQRMPHAHEPPYNSGRRRVASRISVAPQMARSCTARMAFQGPRRDRSQFITISMVSPRLIEAQPGGSAAFVNGSSRNAPRSGHLILSSRCAHEYSFDDQRVAARDASADFGLAWQPRRCTTRAGCGHQGTAFVRGTWARRFPRSTIDVWALRHELDWGQAQRPSRINTRTPLPRLQRLS